ncbi:MAG: hypothetical protein J5663_11875 [Bacteroidaceae bacterium]|nr:hypothetical protein [Bacteroidaceae bacterium]
MRTIYIRKVGILILALLIGIGNAAAKSNNSEEARRMFDKIYLMVFGEQGSHVKYSVNILGLYKTEGAIEYKGKKQRYQEARYASWNDGVTAYMVDKKKQTVGIFDADDDNKDKYLSKFKYDVNDYIFSYVTKGNTYEITAELKHSSFFGIKEVVAVVDKHTLHPQSLNIKLAWFRTTVKITEFSSGNISDDIFIFPRKKFSEYEFVDHRKKK